MVIKHKDPRFIFLKGKIVIFIIVALVGALSFLYFAGKQRGLFTKTENFYCVVSKATGVYTGMSVRLSGFKIGRVQNMELMDDGFVRITLSIEDKHTKWFREGTVAILTKEGFIGEYYIEILPGQGALIKPKQTIKFFRHSGIEEIAAELKGEISEILKGIKETINYVNEPQGDIKKSIHNIEKISQNLVDTTNKLNFLLDDIKDKTPSILAKSENTIEELTELIKSLQNSAKHLNEITSNFNEITKKDLTLIIEQTKRSMEDLDEILTSIKGIWPIREGIKKRDIKPLEADSYEK